MVTDGSLARPCPSWSVLVKGLLWAGAPLQAQAQTQEGLTLSDISQGHQQAKAWIAHS